MTDCMNFPPNYEFLWNGETHSRNPHPEKSVNAGSTADDPEARDPARVDEPITDVSLGLIQERIKANLETLKVQISTLIQLLTQLIQDNSARNSPTAGPRTHRTQPEPSPGSGVKTSRALPRTAICSTGSPLDIWDRNKPLEHYGFNVYAS